MTLPRASSSRRRILECYEDPDHGRHQKGFNPYTALLDRSLTSLGYSVVHFRWRNALFAKYDVVHLHWPDHLLRHPRLSGRVVKRCLTLLFLLRIMLARVPVVRTFHNATPHERMPGIDRRILNRFDSLVAEWICLSEAAQPDYSNAPRSVIPHGHYRDWYGSAPTREQSRQLLCFGQVRAYKGVESLLAAFPEGAESKWSLTVAGAPGDARTAEELQKLAEDLPNVHLDLRFVPDHELVGYLSLCEGVVLPYRHLLNSGAALLALSMGRPIIVPKTDATDLLASEFGEQWVIRYVGDLNEAMLGECLERLASLPTASAPDMSAREWDHIGALTAEVLDRAKWG